MASAGSSDRKCVLRRGSGGGHWSARRQACDDTLEPGGPFPAEISEGAMDAGVDGDGGQWLLLRRWRERSARSELVSGGTILRPRGCNAERQGIANRDATCMAGGIRDRAFEDGAYRCEHFYRAGMAAPEFPSELPPRGTGRARGDEPAQFRAP